MKKSKMSVAEKVMVVIIDCAASGMGTKDFYEASEGLIYSKEELHGLIDPLERADKVELVHLLKGEMLVVDGWNQGDINFFNQEFKFGIDMELNKEEWEDMWC